MGSDVLIRIRKCVVSSTRVCCRSVRAHPFLVGFLCWLYCFYRLFPVLFGLFVSASPVLVTTAILLGTLLSYGESNLPEVEEEEEDMSKRLRSGSEGVVVVERDAGFKVRKVMKHMDSEDEDSGHEHKKEYDSEDEFGDDEDDHNKPLIKGTTRKGVFEKWESEEAGRGVRLKEVDDENGESRMLGEGSERRLVGERVGTSRDEMPNVEYERLDVDDHHSVSGEVDDPYALNTVYSSFRLSPKRDEGSDHHSDSENENDCDSASEIGSDEDVKEEEEEEDDGDENSSDSESDDDDSSSPDASMTDIMPLLDELHSLLDKDASQQAQAIANSTAQRSVDSSSNESTENSENPDDEDGEDDNNDAHSNKDEADKPEISWTEDDQKNLMDMGTSELERNQRLESLIARRMARKMMRIADMKNLIDLESNDLPFNVPYISTQRRNPFDSPNDSYDAMGLPPIPGSAPSILNPRRNPFDLPYDQNEEKPILTGDNFAKEFISPQREAFFRRYESFSVGPVKGGTSRQDMRRRPFFVPEQTAAEEGYASIQRQLSGVSESKASSVPETESVSSASDDDDQKLPEIETLLEENLVSKDYEHDSDHSDHVSKSSDDAELVDVNQHEFGIQLGGQESLLDTDTHTVVIEESSGPAESGHSEISVSVHAVDENSDGSSHSSPIVEMRAEHDEISMEMGYVPDGFSGSVETLRSEMHIPIEQVEHVSDSSSVTSSSEINEEDSDTVGQNAIIRSPIGRESPARESSVTLNVEIPDDHHIKEPVYDSSPTPADRRLLFSSASNDHLPNLPEVGNSSHLSVGDKNEEAKELSNEVGNIQHEHVQNPDVEMLADVCQTSIAETLSTAHDHSDAAHTNELAAGEEHLDFGTEPVSDIDGSSSSSDTDSLEKNSVGNIDQDLLRIEHEEVHSSIQGHSEPVVVVQESNVGPNAPSDSDSLEDQMETGTIQVDRDELPALSSDDDDLNQDEISAVTSNQHVESEGESFVVADQKQSSASVDHDQETVDSSTVEAELIKKTCSDDESSIILPEVSVSIPLKNRMIESIKGMTAGGVSSDKMDEFQTPVSARLFDFTSEEFQPNDADIDEVEDETEDFKELDEAMLAELDVVGDFSVPNYEASSLDNTGMVFHHSDDEVPVEEVILPSLLFGGHAVVRSWDVSLSEPNAPFSDSKEVQSENEDSILLNTDALILKKTDAAQVSSGESQLSETKDVSPEKEELVISSGNVLEQLDVDLASLGASQKSDTKEATSEKEQLVISSTVAPEIFDVESTSTDTSLMSVVKVVSQKIEEMFPSNTDALEKTEVDQISSDSSPSSDTKEAPPEIGELVPLKTDTLQKLEVDSTISSASSNTELHKKESQTENSDHTESHNHSPEETPTKISSKKKKSHDSSSSSSSSSSDSD